MRDPPSVYTIETAGNHRLRKDTRPTPSTHRHSSEPVECGFTECTSNTWLPLLRTNETRRRRCCSSPSFFFPAVPRVPARSRAFQPCDHEAQGHATSIEPQRTLPALSFASRFDGQPTIHRRTSSQGRGPGRSCQRKNKGPATSSLRAQRSPDLSNASL